MRASSRRELAVEGGIADFIELCRAELTAPAPQAMIA